MPRLLDLFSGRWGWSKAFAARGWECVGIDLVVPPEVPEGCTFIRADILQLASEGNGRFTIREFPDRGPILWDDSFDFICASSPCEQFSVHGMKHFHPNPPYPEMGIELFNHTRMLCEAAGVPYVMENVRAAQAFVGKSTHHCGPFHLWGSGVPALMPQGIKKGIDQGSSAKIKATMTRQQKIDMRKAIPGIWHGSGSAVRIEQTAKAATIPPELSACVADYAERLLEVPA